MLYTRTEMQGKHDCQGNSLSHSSRLKLEERGIEPRAASGGTDKSKHVILQPTCEVIVLIV